MPTTTLPLLLLLATASVFSQCEEVLLPLAITTLHFALLEALAEHPLCVREMKTQLGIAHSDCGTLLVELSGLGYVESAWRGSVLYWLPTASGQGVLAAGRHLVEERMAAALGGNGRKQMTAALERLLPVAPKMAAMPATSNAKRLVTS